MALLDIDLDKVLGTTVDPVGGLIGDPQAYSTQKNLGTGLGAVTGYLGSLYKGYTPAQKVMGALSGAQAGRQGVIDRYTKGYMTQQDILKDTLGIRESQLKIPQMQQNIELDALKLRKERAADQAMRNYISTLPPEEQNLLAISPEKWAESRMGEKLSTDDRALISSLGIKDPFNMTSQEASIFSTVKQYPSQKDADAFNQQERQRAIDIKGYKPQYRRGQLDIIQQLTGNKQAAPAYFDATQPTESRKTDGKVIGFNNQVFTKEEYENLPRIERELHNPNYDRKIAQERYAKLEDQYTDYKGAMENALDMNTQIMRDIEQLLTDPEFDKAFGMKNKLLSSAPVSAAGIESKAANIWNQINTLKSKEFQSNLGAMRLASPTGGAVGQVSNMEVGKFENTRANLAKGNDKKTIQRELLKLYDQLSEYEGNVKKKFTEEYGQERTDRIVTYDKPTFDTNAYREQQKSKASLETTSGGFGTIDLSPTELSIMNQYLTIE
jgi:hypothetical protein